MPTELIKTFYFEAAHRNPRGTEKQQRLHGHSYRLDVIVGGQLDERYGWIIDFADIKRSIAPLYELLDHNYLNQVTGLEVVTLEDLRNWIFPRLKALLPLTKNVALSIAGECVFAPKELPPDTVTGLPHRIRFTFEAAQSLPQLPEGHPCRRLHGHTYRIEVGHNNPSQLITHLRELYDTLDHCCLNDIPQLEFATSERLAKWIWDWLKTRNILPTIVVVQETETSRCIYHET